MKQFVLLGTVCVLAAALTTGCSQEKAWPTKKRPLQVVPDLETQKKFRTQGSTELFDDGRMMRMPPAGTVARGSLRIGSPVIYSGKVDGNFVTHGPIPVSMELMKRGRERYDIYCTPCHDHTGTGRGIVVSRGALVPPPSFHDTRLRQEPDGHFFDVISNGIRTMPGYAGQVPAEDRWAIVAYVRALQRSQNAAMSDVPADKQGEIN